MSLKKVLLEKRSQIIDRWYDLILETYPEVTARFLKQGRDRFSNPVGYTTYQDICALYDSLIKGDSPDKLADTIQNIVRVYAVQDLLPSQAISFILTLKNAVKEAIGADLKNLYAELLELEIEIDKLTLNAFDNYMKCREDINAIRIKEIKTQREEALRLLQRIGTI